MSKAEPRWRLYIREGCHLCDEAEVWLRAQGVVDYLRIDIDRELELGLRYGLSVPVLRRVSDGREWSAPWDWEDLARVLAASAG